MKLSDVKIPNKVQFIVHTPSGPIGACEQHKNTMVNLYRVLGCHVGVETQASNFPCINCVNEIQAGIES